MDLEHTIEPERCKGCGLCISICPKKVLALSDTLNGKGYFTAHRVHPKKCVYCGNCAQMCPDVAISIRRRTTASESKLRRSGS